jgi:hypothetical protein
MRLLQRRIQQAAKDGRVSQLVVERDYAQSYVLLGIAGQPELRETLVFKGGTALKKIHFKRYRFSEDLDFSAVDAPREEDLEQAVRAAAASAQAAARAFAPVTKTVERYEERESAPGRPGGVHPGRGDGAARRSLRPRPERHLVHARRDRPDRRAANDAPRGDASRAARGGEEAPRRRALEAPPAPQDRRGALRPRHRP